MIEKDYFPSLTGIRAVAAYLVFMNHFFVFHPNFMGQLGFNIFNELHIGVTVFFVLSGFLICYRYFDYDRINFRDFILKRFARIYPMYFILTTLTFVYFAIYEFHFNLTYLKMYLLNVTFLRGFFENYIYSGIAQGWSLTVEEMFYFFAPLFFILIKRTLFNLVILPLLFIGLGFLLVCFFGGSDFFGLKNYGFMKTNLFMLNLTFFGRITEFFIGIALALFVKKYRNKINTKYFTLIGITVMMLCIYVFMILKVNKGDGKDCYWGVFINNFILPLFGIAPLFWGLITERTIFSKILSSKIFVLLGKSSYCFYLIHLGFFVVIINKVSKNFIFELLILNLISVFLYLFIESPLNRFFRKL